MNNRIHDLIPADLHSTLVALRHDLHRHPELAFQESRTVQRLEEHLAALAPRSLERVAGTGLCVRLAGRDRDAPVVAVRGDIDALPIQEETGAPFASVHDGVMHACGHDVHATWAVGAAHLLAAQPAHGDVVILLQPAEESGRGAPAMIEAGALESVRAVFGAHVDMRFDVGQVVAEPGPVAASADEFEIELLGRGSHAARPHEGSDPIVGAAALITALQSIVTRRVAPGVPAVVTVGAIQAGTAANVIPDRARLRGTVRAADPDTRELLHQALAAMGEDIARAHGLRARVEIRTGTPPLVNGTESVGWAREAVRHLLGDGALRRLPVPNLGGEDFAFYLERLAGCFIRIGARGDGQETVPAHTSRFLPDDRAILVGAAVLAETARRASAALSG